MFWSHEGKITCFFWTKLLLVSYELSLATNNGSHLNYAIRLLILFPVGYMLFFILLK